ncbi:hypothetical protein AAFF_G00243300 [Aldrovandia affinis]|uniref:Uncharacterized protein n=1 Tax=Aldrovandia affinis TaxID=143900 RepID=A0AAD7RDT9_9TELE|nr:hypothetical protein AAFF_G00243300 [Aldrovandia affinis]
MEVHLALKAAGFIGLDAVGIPGAQAYMTNGVMFIIRDFTFIGLMAAAVAAAYMACRAGQKTMGASQEATNGFIHLISSHLQPLIPS